MSNNARSSLNSQQMSTLYRHFFKCRSISTAALINNKENEFLGASCTAREGNGTAVWNTVINVSLIQCLKVWGWGPQ